MGVYDIDYAEAVRQNLPVRLRLAKRRAWLGSLVAGVDTLYHDFLNIKAEKDYEAEHTGQVFSLEDALNDVFDIIGRGIYITDGPFLDPLYIYIVPEEKPVWLATDAEGVFDDPYTAPSVLYTDLEISTTGVDFIVHVPGAVAAEAIYDINRLKAIVNKYKLPGKRYSVVIEP